MAGVNQLWTFCHQGECAMETEPEVVQIIEDEAEEEGEAEGEADEQEVEEQEEEAEHGEEEEVEHDGSEHGSDQVEDIVGEIDDMNEFIEPGDGEYIHNIRSLCPSSSAFSMGFTHLIICSFV